MSHKDQDSRALILLYSGRVLCVKLYILLFSYTYMNFVPLIFQLKVYNEATCTRLEFELYYYVSLISDFVPLVLSTSILTRHTLLTKFMESQMVFRTREVMWPQHHQ